MISVPAKTEATNLASVVDKVTKFCNLLAQLIALVPTLVMKLEVDQPLL